MSSKKPATATAGKATTTRAPAKPHSATTKTAPAKPAAKAAAKPSVGTKTTPNSRVSGTKTPTPKTPTPGSKSTVATNKPSAAKPTPVKTTAGRPAAKTPTKDTGRGTKVQPGKPGARVPSAKGKSAKDAPKNTAFEIGFDNENALDRPQSTLPPNLNMRRQSHAPKTLTNKEIERNLKQAEERKKQFEAAKMQRIHDLDADSKKFTEKLAPYIERELTNSNMKKK